MAENQAQEFEKTADEYFAFVKSKKEEITNEYLRNCLENMTTLATKYQKTKQIRSLKKLKFLTEVLVQEEKLIDLGVTTYIYRQHLEEYLDNVAKDTVKIIDLANYPREIPDEAVDAITKTEGIFSNYYIIYTDYTGREERRVKEERRTKDPILFGVFEDRAFVADRFYVLADWIDDYCDLTLDKLVAEMKETKPCLDILQKDVLPQTSEELLAVLNNLEELKENKNSYINIDPMDTVIQSVDTKLVQPTEGESLENVKKETKSFFSKIKTFFKKDTE